MEVTYCCSDAPREMWESPEMYAHLEKVVYDAPNGKEKLAKMQEWLAGMAEQGDQADEASA